MPWPFSNDSRNQQKSSSKKKKGHGGNREGAGRKLKEYPTLKIKYDPSKDKKTLLKALKDLYEWVLADEIYYRKAATLIHAIEVMAKISIPTVLEDEIDELAAEARMLRKIRTGKTRD